jgi:hypothetical protein
LAASLTAQAGYYAYLGEYVGIDKTTPAGFFNLATNGYGGSNEVYTSYGNDAFLLAYTPDEYYGIIRPDAFSFNNDISTWLDSPYKTFAYTTVENFDENGLNPGGHNGKFGFNDDITVIDTNGTEFLARHAEIQTPPDGHSFGVVDVVENTAAPWNGDGRLDRGNEYVLSDFDYNPDAAPDPNERIYFSAGRYATAAPVTGYLQGHRPDVRWLPGPNAGSDYMGYTNAADVLTQYVDSDGIAYKEASLNTPGKSQAQC